jgi:hypothetical protein
MLFKLWGFFGLCLARLPLPATLVTPSSFAPLRTSGASSLHQIILPSSTETPPFLVKLVGTRQQIGYDYAALLHNETISMYASFMGSMFNASEQLVLNEFVDYCWTNFLLKHVSQDFQDEITGMKQYHTQFGVGSDNITTDQVATRFYTLANMPADTVNIIDMLEQELEKDWPVWLRVSINELIRLIEKILSGCDAFGVWGSRTKGALLYSSRNLDWNKDTGINKYKLVTFYHVSTPSGNIPPYATTGFASGLGALAGMSSTGITVSEMNLDNSRVTFDGTPFPLRLRAVLEGATDLGTALDVWRATNNTNSFNFLIGSAPDALAGRDGAYALETMRNYTSVYGANSARERDSVYYCGPKDTKTYCSWTNQTGVISLGRPLVDAVWRSNHAMDPEIMLTQERLFNDTMFRYNLMADLFTELKGTPIDDQLAADITATLGIKGEDFFSCEQDFHHGSVIMSVVYAPGPRPQAASGYLYVAWEGGQGKSWTPASCMPFVRIDFAPWV